MLVRRENSIDSVSFHDREMHRIPRGKGMVTQKQCQSSGRVRFGNWPNLRTQIDGRVIDRPGDIRLSERKITMQYLLQNFGIRLQNGIAIDGALKRDPARLAQRVLRAGSVHHDICIQKIRLTRLFSYDPF